MHLLVIFVLLFGLVFFVWRQTSNQGSVMSGSARPEASEDISSHINPVYISDGKLFYHSSSNKSIQIESQHVETLKAREEQNKKLSGWKEGTTWDTSFTQMRGMGERHDESNIEFSSVTRSAKGKLLYFLKGAGFGGLFEYCQETNKELRLMHGQSLDYRDLSRPNSEGQLLFSLVQNGSNSNIATMALDAKRYQELTGGDTVDTSPSWVWDRPDHVVYQSQGLARDPDGYVKGVGPAEIILLNTESGDLETIFADDNTDYLRPQVSQNGSLYFISRPYESDGYSQSNIFMDALLFPFRLLRAVFHYLNFFSLMYTRKPLTSAGGPQVHKDAKDLILQGRRVNAQKALRQGYGTKQTPSLVPANWMLIRCDKQGHREVLATHVASYSLGMDDNIIYSNGFGIFYITPQGEHKKVLQDSLIEETLI